MSWYAMCGRLGPVAFGELRFSAREYCRKWTAVKDRLDMRDLAVRDLVPLGYHYDALSGSLCLEPKENSGLMAPPDNGLDVRSHHDLKKPGEGCDVVLGAAICLK
jgi:hypothetical protein